MSTPAGGGHNTGGFGAAPRDYSAAAAMTSRLQDAVAEARRDPAKKIGIAAEELNERRKLALSPRSFFSDKTQRGFEVKSSTRAQQIMNKGLLGRQREMRNREIMKKMTILRRMRVGMFFLGVGLTWWFGVTFLLPRYAAVQERGRVMQLRYELAQRKREAAAEQH